MGCVVPVLAPSAEGEIILCALVLCVARSEKLGRATLTPALALQVALTYLAPPSLLVRGLQLVLALQALDRFY